MNRTIRIELFAIAKDHAGCDHVDVSVPATCKIDQFKHIIAAQHPSLASILPACRIAMDDQYCSDDQMIDTHASICLIPPVSGG